jgi:cell division protein DivIC
MNVERIKRLFRTRNRYLMVTIGFAVWMLIFDEEIEKLEKGIHFYQLALAEDRDKLEQLQSDPWQLERFAREQYWMCRPGEEVFLVPTE